MTKAYLFVSAKAGRTKDVVKALARLSGVKAADICWSLPDIIAVVSVKNERAPLAISSWARSRRSPASNAPKPTW